MRDMTSLNIIISSAPTVTSISLSSAQQWTTRSLEAMAGDLSRLLENKTLGQYLSQLSSITWPPVNDRRGNHGNGGKDEVEVSHGLVWTLVAPLVLLVIFVGLVALLAVIWRCRDRHADALDDEDEFHRGGNSQDQSSAEYELSVMDGGGSHWNGSYYDEGRGDGAGFSRQADGRNANCAPEDKGSSSSSRGTCLVWKKFRGMSPDGMIDLSNVLECSKTASVEDIQSSLKQNVGQGHLKKSSVTDALTWNQSQPSPDIRNGKHLFDLTCGGQQLKGQHSDTCMHCQGYCQRFPVQPHLQTMLFRHHPHPQDILYHHIHLEVQNQPSPLGASRQCCYCQRSANSSQRNVLIQQQGNYSSLPRSIRALQHISRHPHHGVENPLFTDDENDKDCNSFSTNAATKYNIHKLDSNGNHLYYDTSGIVRETLSTEANGRGGACVMNSNHVTRHFLSPSEDNNEKSCCQQHQPYRAHVLRFPKSPLVEGPDVSCIKMYSAASLSLRKSCPRLPSPRSSMDSNSISTSTSCQEREKSVDSLSLPSSICRFHASRVQPFDLALPSDAAYPSRGNPLVALLFGAHYDNHETSGVLETDVVIGNGSRESQEHSDDVISVQPNVGSSTTSCEEDPSESAAGQGSDESDGMNGSRSRSSSASELDDAAAETALSQLHCRDGSVHFPAGLFSIHRQRGPLESARDVNTERVTPPDLKHAHTNSWPGKKPNKRSEPEGNVWDGYHGSERELSERRSPNSPASAAELKRSKGSLALRDTTLNYVKHSRKSDKVYRMQESFLYNMQQFSMKGSPDEDYVVFDPSPEHTDSKGIEKIYLCQTENKTDSPGEWSKLPESQNSFQRSVSPFNASTRYEREDLRSADLCGSPSENTIHKHVQEEELSRYCDRFLNQQKNNNRNLATLNLAKIDRNSGRRRASDFSGVKPTRLAYDTPQSDTRMQESLRKRKADWSYATFDNFHEPQAQLTFLRSASPDVPGNQTQGRPTSKQLIRLPFERSPFEAQKYDLSFKEQLRQKQPRKSRRHSDGPRTSLGSSKIPCSKARTKRVLQEYAWDYAYLNVGSSFGEEINSLDNSEHPVVSRLVIVGKPDQNKKPNNLDSPEESSETILNNLVTDDWKKLNTDASSLKADSTLHPSRLATVEKACSPETGTGNESTGSFPPVSGDEVFGVWNMSPELGSDVSLSYPRTPLMTPLNDEAKRAMLKFVWGVSNPPSSISTGSPLIPTWTAKEERREVASMVADPVSIPTSSLSHRTLYNICTSGDDCDNCDCSSSSSNNNNITSTTTGPTSSESYKRSRRQLQLSPIIASAGDRTSSLSADPSVTSSSNPSTPVVCSKEYWL